MKRIILFCLALISCVLLQAQRKIDVLHYTFRIGLSDSSDNITGEAFIRFRMLETTPNLLIDLAAVNPATSKGMKAGKVMMKGLPLTYTQTEQQLNISLGAIVSVGDTAEVQIQYSGVPSDGLIISKNKYGHRTFFADNWPNRGHNWLPCIDDPGDKASVDFIITAPQHYQVVSNGLLIEETNLPANKKLTHWREDVPINTKVMVIGVAEFAVQRSGTIAGCIPVYSWVYPEDRDKGFYDYEQANEILPFFIREVGPYGYRKLANVQSKTIFGGLENANTIFYAEGSVRGDRRSEGLLTHEIAHQWFGNMATEKSFAHLWLSEGFATYMTIYYMESKYGRDTAVKMLEEDRKQVAVFARKSNRAIVDEDPDFMKLLNANSYQKGGWVLHMLRQQLGHEVFMKAIKKYYAQYAGSNADTRDLQHIFEQVSGKSLKTFFDQWLYQPGIPQLDIKWNYAPRTKKITITVKQLQPQAFSFPLKIAIQCSGGKKQTQVLQVKNNTETFTFSLTGTATSVLADPDTELLFEGTVTGK